MALNLIKLCVGCDSVEDLEEWIAFRLDERKRAGEPVEQWHTTRMVPTRAAELTDGGSLYWVIKGSVQCRQRLVDIRPLSMARASRAAISCWTRWSCAPSGSRAVPSRAGAT